VVAVIRFAVPTCDAQYKHLTFHSLRTPTVGDMIKRSFGEYTINLHIYQK
jgi:hypothetical protein